jgi:LPS O-antigen subunit length determinant protein (WzzB/FepE family)
MTKTPRPPFDSEAETSSLDFHDLVSPIWTHKFKITAATLISLILSMAFVSGIDPLFRAEALLTPPAAESLTPLNLGYRHTRQRLLSQKDAFTMGIDELEALNTELSNTNEPTLQLDRIGPTGAFSRGNVEYVIASVVHQTPEMAARFLTTAIQRANEIAVTRISDEFDGVISSHKESLEVQLLEAEKLATGMADAQMARYITTLKLSISTAKYLLEHTMRPVEVLTIPDGVVSPEIPVDKNPELTYLLWTLSGLFLSIVLAWTLTLGAGDRNSEATETGLAPRP